MSARAKPLSVHRRRLKRRGVVRVEVHVRKDDAALIRGVARALDDPERADQARALLRARFTPEKAPGFKALPSAGARSDFLASSDGSSRVLRAVSQARQAKSTVTYK